MSGVTKRNESPSDVETVLPDFIAQDADPTACDHMAGEEFLPLAKTIQGQTKRELKDLAGGEGALLANPIRSILAKPGNQVTVIPVGYWKDFTKVSDVKDTAADFILERTRNEHSEVAKKAQNKNARTESYPTNPEWKYQYRVNYNFICYIDECPDNPEMEGSIVAFIFSSGDFFVGQQWISRIRQRHRMPGNPAPFCQRWHIGTELTSNNEGQEYFAKAYFSPENGEKFVQDKEKYLALKAMAEDLKGRIAEGKVGFDYSDEKDSHEGGSAEGKARPDDDTPF